jgi:hypothetical protein
LEDPRIHQLRELIREVTRLQQATKRLIAELTDQLHRTSSIRHDGPFKERRKKPRNN